MPVTEFLEARPRLSLLFSLLLTAATVLIVFWPATHNGLVWDDHITFEQAATYKHLTLQGMEKAISQPLIYSGNYFRPLPVLSFMLQMKWFGLDLEGFHLFSIIIHILNTLILSFLVWKLADGVRIGSRLLYVVLGGLIYGLHPALVEPVVFVSSRFDLLTTFFLASVLLIDQLKIRTAVSAPSVGVMFLLAALSKEMALALPLCLPFFHVAIMKNRPSTFMGILRRLREDDRSYTYLAIIAGGLVYLLLRYQVLGYFLHTNPGIQSEIGGTAHHIALVFKSLAEYLLLMFLPFGRISAVHSVTLPISFTDTSVWVGLVIAVAAVVITAAFHAREKFNPGWSILAVIASLFPVLNVLPTSRPTDAYFAESFLVFPIFIAVLLLILTWQQFRAIHPSKISNNLKNILMLVPVVWLALSIFSAIATIPLWKSDRSLWGYALYKQKSVNLLALNNYTGGLIEDGDTEQAREVAKKTVNEFPDNADGWHMYAITLSRIGDFALAEIADQNAIRLAPNIPHYYVSLGYSLYRLHRVGEAKKSYLKALEIDKDFTPALKSLAYLSEELHEYSDADMYMRHAISMTTSVPDKQKLQAWLEEAEARRKISK